FRRAGATISTTNTSLGENPPSWGEWRRPAAPEKRLRWAGKGRPDVGESRAAAGERNSPGLSAVSVGGTRDEAARALLAAVVESSADAMVTATPDGRITTWNPAAERMYGYTAAEAIGMHISKLVVPKLVGPTDEIFAAVLAGKRFTNLEARSVRKDGTPMYVSVTAFPVL